jgi:peptide-methionine (R)-S-oxide reductase
MMTTTLSRRRFLATAAVVLPAVAPTGLLAAADPFANSPWRKISDAEWRKRLPAESYEILRREGTEPAWTSPLLKEHRVGTFACLGCGLSLFKSQWKYDSGTGWPSFYTAIPGALEKKADFLLIAPRTEYHCARCLGHQGHVFNDGPRPTGLRYCNDGVALKFIPA